MPDPLLKYYNRELSFLRHMGAEFAERYPKVAAHLHMENGQVNDPHVSRLLEGVALLSAQIRQKLDDGFPELTESLLGQLYPDFQMPLPSMAVVQMKSQHVGHHPLNIAKNTPVKLSYQADHEALQQSSPAKTEKMVFRTGYDTQIWPFQVSDAQFINAPFPSLHSNSHLAPYPQAQALLKLSLQGEQPNLQFQRIQALTQLRFHLHGQASLTQALYQFLLQSCMGIALVDPKTNTLLKQLSPLQLQAVGFTDGEQMLPYQRQSFDGFCLLVEHFCFPEKFMFVDLCGLSAKDFAAGEQTDIYFYFDQQSAQLAQQVMANNLQLGCVPIINLFSTAIEPIAVTGFEFEAPLRPAYVDSSITEVIQLQSLAAFDQHYQARPLAPLYQAGAHSADPSMLYWQLHRRYCGSSLTLLDANAQGLQPESETVLIQGQALCSNGDLPSQLPLEPQRLCWSMPKKKDLLHSIQLRTAFSVPVRPALVEQTPWQLMNHLNLHYFSHDNHQVDEQQTGKARLQALLRLYDFKKTPQTNVLIEAIAQLSVVPTTQRLERQGRLGFCHGSAIHLTLESSELTGTNSLLFGNVLCHFFAQYCSINSFIQFNLYLTGQSEVFHQWPPMAGKQALL